jgi:uroporphyrinogen decarboxylase
MGVIGQHGDIFTTSWEMMGFEDFSLSIYEEPELIEALFEKIGSLIFSMFKTMSDMDHVGALWYSDDIAYTSGLMVSPAFLREQFFPWLKKIGDLAKNRGIPFLYHTDGVLYDVFEDIIASGVTAQHPIEPLAMDIVEVKQRVGDRLCLCGNIDVDILSRGSVEEVRALVRKRLEQLGPGGGYCLGSSNSVPDYALVENYLAMVETTLEFRA